MRARTAAAATWALLAGLGAGLSAGPAGAGDLDALLAEGDAAWERRAEGHDGRGHAAPEPVQAALDAYARAAEANPDALDAWWRLIRALHFAGEFAARDDARRKAFFDRAAERAEQAFAALERLADDPDAVDDAAPDAVGAAFAPGLRPAVARVHFWAAIAWGAWSQHHGLLAAVREGVAGRLRRYAQVVLALEPGLEQGGAHRLLASLHANLPKVPLLTGWVDRDRAFEHLDLALAEAPGFPGNRLLLALTLLELRPGERARARRLLEEVAQLEPAPDAVVEELAMRQTARERLAALRGGREEGGAG